MVFFYNMSDSYHSIYIHTNLQIIKIFILLTTTYRDYNLYYNN